MRIFVTGATGVVGRRAVPLLVGAGHRVSALARSLEQGGALARVGATAVHADLFDRTSLRRALAGHDAVVNLATHLPRGWRMLVPSAWAENDRIRRIASANLVDAALAVGVDRFIQESFAPVYPDHGSAWIDEGLPIAPSRYNRSVADAEAAADRFAAAGHVAVVLRFAAFYGPDARQVHDLIAAVRHGFAPLPGAPDAYISSVAHDDAASAVAAALGVPGGIYNVADDEPLTHRDYVDTLAAALGVPPPRLLPRWSAVLFGSVGGMLARSLRIANRKLRATGRWAPRTASLRRGWPALVAEWRGRGG